MRLQGADRWKQEPPPIANDFLVTPTLGIFPLPGWLKIVLRNLVEVFLQFLQPAQILPSSLHMQGCLCFPASDIKGY